MEPEPTIPAPHDINPRLQDLTHLDWSESVTTSATGGADFADFLWNMIWERWCAYEGLRDCGRLEAQG